MSNNNSELTNVDVASSDNLQEQLEHHFGINPLKREEYFQKCYKEIERNVTLIYPGISVIVLIEISNLD